ncbi:DUF3352 domain-containing protein [Acaryochloris sp. IP29b_bin.137]|uniref:DUF3352 domain-containing protein n=1 Tax=Acaryochloris sp. IP29b_bin.137 TaxID=2969217 RepID=UPI00261F094E|nr:DUF3352 domain-containing protein [Acaryochloris sp. IP29b_bin.137]
MVKLRSVFLQLLASVLALLLCSGTVWALDTDSSAGTSPLEPELGPAAARFIPDAAPLMVSLVGHSGPLKSLGDEAAGHSFQYTDLPAALLATAGIDYRQDIRPWAGDELTFALTELGPGQGPGYLLVLKARNSRDANTFLEKFWQLQAEAGQSINFERYDGIDIISAQVSPQFAGADIPPLPHPWQPIQALSTAKVDDRFVLVTNHHQVLEQALSTFNKPGSQLAKHADYKTAIATLNPTQSTSIAYLNLEKLIPALSGKPAGASATYKGLGVTFGESRQGVWVETALIANSDRQVPTVHTKPLEPTTALSYFPGNSPLVVSGMDLGALWSQIDQDLQGYPALKAWVNTTLGAWGQTRGLSLTSQIFPLIDGNYAWALLPESLSPVLSAQPDAKADWLFAYEQTNSDHSQQLTRYLNDLATQQDLGTSPFELAGRKVYAWTRLVSQEIDNTRGSNLTFKTEVTGAYANIDDQKVLASSPEALGLALEAGNGALSNQRSFQDAIAPFDQPNQGFVYLDWPMMQPFLKQNLPIISKLEAHAQTLTHKLRSISVSSYGETPEVQHSKWYLRFG